MSYCRFSDDSDVYAYACDGGIQFWVAGNADKGLDHLCNTLSEAYRYAKELRDKHGLMVPDYAIECLRDDAIEEAKHAYGIGSAITELASDNDRLRELAKYAILCSEGDALCEGCPYHTTEDGHIVCTIRKAAAELRIEVPE